MLRGGTITALLLALLICGGCATGYVHNKRTEWNSTHRNTSVYGDFDRYPAVYRATCIAAAVEIPTWWWPPKHDYTGSYHYVFCIFGMPLSLIDLPISVVTDTLMFPYDLYKTLTKEDET
jgi:uncharacterized protein YceK